VIFAATLVGSMSPDSGTALARLSHNSVSSNTFQLNPALYSVTLAVTF